MALSRVLDLCLQLELSLSSLEELEGLWAAIPPEQHRAWGTRLESLVVHGSPTWRVYRVSSPDTEGLSGLEGPSTREQGLRVAKEASESAGLDSLLAARGTPAITTEAADDARYMLDWKGDKIKVRCRSMRVCAWPKFAPSTWKHRPQSVLAIHAAQPRRQAAWRLVNA